MGRRLFSGEDGSILRTITSTKAGENLGFDAVGIGDVNRDGILDALLAAATGDHVYVVAGVRSSFARTPLISLDRGAPVLHGSRG